MGIIAYTAVKYYGGEYYREYIDSRYDLATEFAGMVKSDASFELAALPDANIVCFRYFKKGLDENDLNRINSAIRNKIIKEGTFYIVQTELEGKIWLRVTIINPVTSATDLMELLERVKDCAINLPRSG